MTLAELEKSFKLRRQLLDKSAENTARRTSRSRSEVTKADKSMASLARRALAIREKAATQLLPELTPAVDDLVKSASVPLETPEIRKK